MGKKKAAGNGILDVETHFAFYGAYHSNPINILIHSLFVWPIFFTTLMLFYYTPSFFHFPQLGFHHPLLFNFGFFFALFYALFYLLLDFKAGAVAALLCFSCWVGSSFASASLGSSLGWKVAAGVQLFCWITQFIGHGVFEKRAPAILDNLAQAILTAPFFILLEVLHQVFNYEPYPGFQESVKAKSGVEIQKWKEMKQKSG
ncbi:2-hydroxy-palmitic acid dioxygenase mpo1 [Linum grandiflorum]